MTALGCNATHDDVFYNFQAQTKEVTRLSHLNLNLVLCISTDASDKHWYLAATQSHAAELDKALPNQAHKPLAFFSGSFSEQKEHWSTYEREAFSIVQYFRKLDYILSFDTTTRVFTDHHNL